MKINKNNACVYVLAGRLNLIEECVERFFEFYNYKFNFPFYIYHFDNLFDKNQKNIILSNRLTNKFGVKFININTSLPKNISNKELYFNRDYKYVKKSFGPERVNYLHMCNFFTNSNNKPDLDNFRFHHRIDDDVFLQKKIDDNLFEIMFSKNYILATSKLWNEIKINTIDTRRGLFDFYNNYIEINNLTPQNNQLKNAITTKSESLFHKLYWSTGHFNLYDHKYIRDDLKWKRFLDLINSSGGIYKYRWGDMELIGLYLYTFFQDPKLDLQLSKDGYLTDNSKGAKMLTNDNIFRHIIKKTYRKLKYQILKL